VASYRRKVSHIAHAMQTTALATPSQTGRNFMALGKPVHKDVRLT